MIWRMITFQFHYGTIKRCRFGCRFQIYIQFQFHYGTIKSPLFVAEMMGFPCFNSTMVRLKVIICFSSSFVLISFNSTMVRLKAMFVKRKMAAPTLFQFHYGTIKSVATTTPPRSSRVSIPLWYD